MTGVCGRGGGGVAHIKGHNFVSPRDSLRPDHFARRMAGSAAFADVPIYRESGSTLSFQRMAFNFRFLPQVKNALEVYSFDSRTRVMSNGNVVHCIRRFIS